MKRASLICLLLAAPLPLAAAQEPGLPADFAALVPNDAVVLVQMRSTAELAGFVERVRQREAPEDEPMTADRLASELLSGIGLALDGAHVDAARPLGVAFAISPEAPEPRTTFVLPAKDAGALLAAVELPEAMYSSARSGGYVALALGGAAAPARGGSRLAQGGPQGLVSARVDLHRLISDFGPLIEMQLDQLEMMLGSGAMSDPDMPFDASEMLDWYLQLAWDLVDSAELLDASFDVREGELRSSFTLTNREGSPLAALARPEQVDYRAALALVDPRAPIQMVMRYDQSGYVDAMWSVYDSLLEALEDDGEVPTELVAALRAYLDGAKTLMHRAGQVTAASVDFAPGGFRMMAAYFTQEPAELLRGWLELMSAPALNAVGLSTGAPEEVELAGRRATAWTTHVDLRALMAVVPDEERPSADELGEMQALVDGVIGEQGMRLALLPMEQRLGLLAGGDVAWRAAAAERMVRGGELPVGLAHAAEELAGANPGMLLALDLNAGLARVLELMVAAGQDGDDAEEVAEVLRGIGDQPVPCRMHWGVRGRVWEAGMTADLEGILRLVELTGARAREEEKRLMAHVELARIDDAVRTYAAEHDGTLPGSLELLLTSDRFGGPYLDRVPEDPWGRPYRYRPTEGGYEIISLGADGEPGGEGDDADLSSREGDEQAPPGDSPFVYRIF